MPFCKGDPNINRNGRPKNKTFREYFSETEIEDLVKAVKKRLKQDNVQSEIFKLTIEQIFGKASQNLNLGGQEDNLLQIKIIRADVDQGNNIT